MTGPEQERHVRPPTDAHIHALSAAAQRDLEQRVRREEQERHVEQLAREACRNTGHMVGGEFPGSLDHAILDELRNDETGGGYDDAHFRTVWNAALAAVRERL